MKTNQITREFLQKQYIELGVSLADIANQLGCNQRTVAKALKSYSIPIRSCSRVGRANKKIYVPNCDLIGTKIGKLYIRAYETGGYICDCDCGVTKKIPTKRFNSKSVNSCGCGQSPSGKHSPKWSGVGDMSLSYFSRLKIQAIQRGKEFTITPNQVWELFLSQHGLCKISGLPISFLNKTASVDRIDSYVGYVPGNIQLLHRDINYMKLNHSQQRFIDLCRLVSLQNATETPADYQI